METNLIGGIDEISKCHAIILAQQYQIEDLDNRLKHLLGIIVFFLETLDLIIDEPTTN
jgi:hypothetical protein